MSGLRIPAPSTTLQIYRHLLREASYLPPVARPYISKRIKTHFHSRRNNTERVEQYLRQARHDLRYLRAANAGSVPRMRKVLLLVFGRTGRRRRELLNKFGHPAPPADSTILAQLANAGTVTPTRTSDPSLQMDWLDRWDTSRLHAFAKSQSQLQIEDTPTKPLLPKHLYPEKRIPTTTVWGTPPVARLARKKLRNGWKTLLHKILPPVTKGEWDLLHDLASGAKSGPEWDVPARRRLARPTPTAGSDQTSAEPEWRWDTYVIGSAQRAERQHSRSLKILGGQVDETSPHDAPPIDVHRFTPRLWRRLYQEIWNMTATVNNKPGGKGLDINWGRRELRVPTATGSSMEFFEGATEDSKKGQRAKR